MGTANDKNNGDCAYANQQECGFFETIPDEFSSGLEYIPRYLPEHQKLENIIQDGSNEVEPVIYVAGKDSNGQAARILQKVKTEVKKEARVDSAKISAEQYDEKCGFQSHSRDEDNVLRDAKGHVSSPVLAKSIREDRIEWLRFAAAGLHLLGGDVVRKGGSYAMWPPIGRAGLAAAMWPPIGRAGLAAAMWPPMGRAGLAAAIWPPIGRAGLAAAIWPPMGRAGLAAAIWPPMGRAGLAADTFALATQGTTRVASNIADDSSFMAKVSRILDARGIRPAYFEP
jgi:predicted small metal-binding protein